MPTNPLVVAAVVIWTIFTTGMLVGFVLTMGSLIARRRGSAVAVRLMLSGPPAGLCAAALFVLAWISHSG